MAKKDNKKRNKVIAIIVIIILALFLFKSCSPISSTGGGTTSPQVWTLGGGGGATVSNAAPFLEVTLYDAEGNKIRVLDQDSSQTQTSTMSIVNGIPGVASIGVTARATNTGSQALNCQIVSAAITPSGSTLFSTNMDLTSKAVPVGGITTWSNTALIPITSFEGTTQTFTATLRCTYNAGSGVQTLTDKVGSFSITVTPEGGAAVSFTLDSSGMGTQFCGDGTCTAAIGETSATCPQDCAAPTLYVKFRTTANNYPTGSAIAVRGDTCGNTVLTAYGMQTAGITGGTCELVCNNAGTCTSPAYLYDVPGDIIPSGDFVPNAPTKLYSCSNPLIKCLCQAGTNSVNGANAKRYVTYGTADSDASKVSTAALGTNNPQLEVTC